MKKRILSLLLVGLAMVLLLVGCGTQTKTQSSKETMTVTDILGNQVQMPKEIHSIAITPIPWAAVVMTIDGGSDRIVAMNPSSMTAYKGHFLEKADAHFGQVDTQLINKDFSVQAEVLAKKGADVILLWDYQDKEAEKMASVGIPAIRINNKTIDDLKKGFLIVGKLLGKEEKAQRLNRHYDEAYAYLQAHHDQIAQQHRPTLLYLKNKKLDLQGSTHFIRQVIETAGGDYIGGKSKSITMEEILRVNPEIILLSNFDNFVPEDLYENRIPGQDWSTVKAVQMHQVYKVPLGIYRWDAPGVETPLMMKWLAKLLHPEIFTDVHIRQETRDFIKEMIGYTPTDEDLKQIFADEANAHSKVRG